MTVDSRASTPARDDSVRRDPATPGPLGIVTALLAYLLLDQIFAFGNRISTLAIEPRARLSIELLVAVGLLAIWKRRGRALPRTVIWLAGAVIAAAAALRYLDVTAPGVLGRRFDLNADLPHVGNVASMFVEALSPWQQLAILGAVAGALIAATLVCAGALHALDRGLESPALRWIATVSAILGVVLFVAQQASYDAPSEGGLDAAIQGDDTAEDTAWDPWVGRMESHLDDPTPWPFAEPVTSIVGRQLATLRRGSGELRLRSVVPSSLSGLEDDSGIPAHVVLIFLESYGVTLIDDPQHFPYIEATYNEVEADLVRNGFVVGSVRAISPTFGGGSWRAHATLMSGIRIDNEQLYDRLLESQWRGLPHLLAEKGYRTVAAEPGIRDSWPEGDGLRLDRVYDAHDLDYRGPPIGWWIIPDQYTLYKMGRAELTEAERPVFAKISLILSHIPYVPIPPVVEDWSRFDSGTAYPSSLPSVGADDYRDLTELSIRYVAAFRYELEILKRWLIDELPHNTLVIVSGDHQPPMLSTHSNDSWDVPLHVFSRRPELVEAFVEAGFAPGLVPPSEARLPMESFLRLFLEIFDG